MANFHFSHDGPVFVLADESREVAYYSLNGLKYQRIRLLGMQTWKETMPQQIDANHFFMIVACIQSRKVRQHGILGLG